MLNNVFWEIQVIHNYDIYTSFIFIFLFIYLLMLYKAGRPALKVCRPIIRGGFREVSEVSRNHSGFPPKMGVPLFSYKVFTRHAQQAE